MLVLAPKKLLIDHQRTLKQSDVIKYFQYTVDPLETMPQ